MTSTPEIPGYRLDQRLLAHPLAEIWRGRSSTGMEIVALLLSEAGAGDPVVRERLGAASRGAAFGAGRDEAPLWAANLTAGTPYAITQLIPGQSGAERLIDPLDGLLGNDEESIAAVRQQLVGFGAAPVPGVGQVDGEGGMPGYAGTAEGAQAGEFAPSAGNEGSGGGAGAAVGAGDAARAAGRGSAEDAGDTARAGSAGRAGVAGAGSAGSAAGAGAAKAAGSAAGTGSGPRERATARAGSGAMGAGGKDKQKPGGWVYAVAVVVVLIVFSLAYSVGAAVGSKTKERKPAAIPPPVVSPGPLPSPVLLPGIVKPPSAPWSRLQAFEGLVGATYALNAEVEVVRGIGLPFEFGFPEPPVLEARTAVESASTIYRRVLTAKSPQDSSLDVRIAVRPCDDLAGCLADRAAFDKEWTTAYKAPVPRTAKDKQTWYTLQTGKPHAVTMSHAFSVQGRWWLVGVAATAMPGQEAWAEQVVNDIWRQTS